MSRRRGPRVVARWVDACSETGQVACMDCIEGQCAGSRRPVKVQIHECTRCSGHDVYGEMYHDDECPLAPKIERTSNETTTAPASEAGAVGNPL